MNWCTLSMQDKIALQSYKVCCALCKEQTSQPFICVCNYIPDKNKTYKMTDSDNTWWTQVVNGRARF